MPLPVEERMINSVGLQKVLDKIRPTSNCFVPISSGYIDFDTYLWTDTETKKPTYEECIDEEIKIKREISLNFIRNKRNILLRESDVYSLPDWPHASEERKQAWLDYRQALRDLPANTEDPSSPTWPQEPTD